VLTITLVAVTVVCVEFYNSHLLWYYVICHGTLVGVDINLCGLFGQLLLML
jgi:hypothetical protein